MKSVKSAGPLFISLIALGLALWNHLGRPTGFEGTTPLAGTANSPEGVVEIVMRGRTAPIPPGNNDHHLRIAELAYHRFHKDEVLKTLEVVETSESGDYGIAFYRYSIGTDIIRRAMWCGKVNGKWYWKPYFYDADNYDKPADEEWYEKMKEKKLYWETGVEKFI